MRSTGTTSLTAWYALNEWNHLVLYANEHTNEATLLLESTTYGTQTQNLTLGDYQLKRVIEGESGDIYVGTDKKTRYFTGMIDEVKVSVPEPVTITLLSLGAALFLRRRKV
jgi:hypothetical protein